MENSFKVGDKVIYYNIDKTLHLVPYETYIVTYVFDDFYLGIDRDDATFKDILPVYESKLFKKISEIRKEKILKINEQ